jgi:hypothetical protein
VSVVVPNKNSLILGKVKTLLGDPIIKMLDVETESLKVSTLSALVRYWTAFPYVYQDTIDVRMTGDYIRNISDVFDAAFGTDTSLPIRQQAFYIGPVRQSEMSRAIQYSNLDAYLLNIPFGTPPRLGSYGLGSDAYTGPLNVDAIIREQSEIDYLAGNVEYRYDQVNNRLIFMDHVFS